MILARSSSEAPPLAAMASSFQRPIRRPGAFFSFAITLSHGTELAGPDHRILPLSAPRNGMPRAILSGQGDSPRPCIPPLVPAPDTAAVLASSSGRAYATGRLTFARRAAP